MADNIKVNPAPDHSALDIATDDINDVHYPIYKISYGALGNQTPVSPTNPLPVKNIISKTGTGKFLFDVALGLITGCSLVHKFGAVTLGGTALTPVCQGGFYRTPQVTSPVTLEVISDDANDTAAGTGAREVTLQYLDVNGVEQTGTIATNGTSASTETISGIWRLFRAWVSSSGSYSNQTTASQNGTITIRVSGAGATWAVIPEIGTTGIAIGQSLIGAYTVPAGKTAYILSSTLSVASGKTPSLYFFARTDADETAAPYSGTMRLKNLYSGVVGGTTEIEHLTYESYSALTDIGFFAIGSNGDEISVEFELLLVDI